jgi:hypothetical protein
MMDSLFQLAQTYPTITIVIVVVGFVKLMLSGLRIR